MASQYNYSHGGQQEYGSGGAYSNSEQAFIQPGQAWPQRQKKRTSKWIKIGIPVLVLLIAAGVAVAVVLTRKKSSSSSSASGGSSSGDKLASGRFATATNSEFMMPIYPSSTDTAAFGSPTFVANNALAWPSDSFAPTNPSVLSVRPDRPRLIAPAYKWAALPNLIANDPYLNDWNSTIFLNASQYYDLPPVVYNMDGDSGILDNAREVKMRIKAFSYVYRMTNDTKWADRTWAELKNAAGNGSTPFGPDVDRWNSANHFLDTAEFSAAFGLAYDWLYDIWTAEQRGQIMSTLITYGLEPGVQAYTNTSVYTGWWRTNTTGNWNCVCNGGLTMGSLAILNDDTTGIAQQLLGLTVDNANGNCAMAVSDDGTWAETANYWYFGTTGHAEMAASLLTATGSHFGLLDTNPNFQKTGDFHMYITGPTSLFNYGDHGPNKFSTTANSMIFYADQYNEPDYALFQRDQRDAAEPWSMFWYDPSIAGAFWNGKPLDHFFDNGVDQWASMRSSWTDNDALYVAMKAGTNQGHQAHNDLDVGDFVLDALGTRWAGELGSADYLSPGYFTDVGQDGARWKNYRKMTEGQNTILIGETNQNLFNTPATIKHDTTQTSQGASTVLDVSSDSTAFWTADTTNAYFNVTSMKRGVRLLNGRKQVLIQDEITSAAPVQWRMHTNATITGDGTTTATLALDGQTMQVSILNAPDGAQFSTSDAVRLSTDVANNDQPNPGVKVLIISLPAGQYNLQVLFNPQDGKTNFVTPPSIPLDSWTLTSHSV
ncbi:chondroitin AC/alginate lyase [Mycena filopes]|nr:chondroitin AC/alginate lyase [Mycena filopes]